MAAIAICCTDARLRERLERLLRATPGIAVAGIVESMQALERTIERSQVDAVLADTTSREQLKAWHLRHPGLPLVALVAEADAESTLDALHAGAAAVVPHSAGVREIAAVIEGTVNGLAILPRQALEALLEPHALDVGEPLVVETEAKIVLTPRELEVLAAMADGASNKVIARRLGISFHTAKFHVAAILAKLDADSRTEAVTKAAHLGLVML
jgi:DNA-binding NarL/FixJ family response regulator